MRRRAPALCALLALPLAAAFSGYVEVPGPPFVSPAASLGFPSSAARAEAVAAAAAAAFGPTPSDVVVDCALLNLGLGGPSNQYSDGYVSFARPVSPELAGALAALQPGSALPLQLSDLDGLLVRVLLQLATQLGFTLQFIVVAPPASLVPPSSNNTDSALMYALRAHNATCTLWPSPLTPTRRLYMRQSVPVLNFAYQVITKRPEYASPSTLRQVFNWCAPAPPALPAPRCPRAAPVRALTPGAQDAAVHAGRVVPAGAEHLHGGDRHAALRAAQRLRGL
jgi:hypothetical protein